MASHFEYIKNLKERLRKVRENGQIFSANDKADRQLVCSTLIKGADISNAVCLMAHFRLVHFPLLKSGQKYYLMNSSLKVIWKSLWDFQYFLTAVKHGFPLLN